MLPHWGQRSAYKPKIVKPNRRVSSVRRSIKSRMYKVRKGDNLTWIARRNKTTISKIVTLNKLKKKTVFIGQKLRIPGAKQDNTYTVKPGDFLLKIAKNHNLSIRKLRKLNSMKGSKIFPGQKLVVSLQ
jgi:LysM repeat protein